MKKILKWIGIGFVGLIIITIIAVIVSPEGKKNFDEGQNKAKAVVENAQPTPTKSQSPVATTQNKESQTQQTSKVDEQAVKENNRKALNGEIVEVQECKDAYYELMGSTMQTSVKLGEVQIPQGLLLTKAWTDYLQKRPTVDNAGYFYYPDSDGKCIVGFSVNFNSGMRNVYTYKQEGGNFVAKNAPAMRLTPWFDNKKSMKEDMYLTAREQEIYDYGVKLNNEYMSQYDSYTAEEKSLADTAKKYGISEAEVIEIIDKATRNLIKSR